MKNTARLLIVILILTMMLPTLAACRDVLPLGLLDEQTRAGVILDKIDDLLKSSESYTVHAETKVSGMSAVSPLVYTATIDEKMVNRNSKQQTFISKMVNEFDYDIEDYDYTLTQIEGYTKGHMFRSVETDGFKSKFKSLVTPAEITLYDEERNEDSLIPRSMLSSSKGEEGSWVVTITEMDEETIDRLSMDVISIIPGYYVESATIVVTVKEDFSSWTSEAIYSYKEIEGYEFPDGFFYRPVISSITTYSDLNSTTVEDIDLTDYTLIDNVNIISKTSNDLLDKTMKTSGSFSTVAKHTLIYQGRGTIVKETFDVDYGVKDGGFYHSCYHYVDKTYYPISYSQGVRKDNGVKSSSADDFERRYLYEVFTFGGFNPLFVSDVKKSEGENGATVYTFDIHVTESMAAQYSVYTTPYSSGIISVDVTYVGDEITHVSTSIRTWVTGSSAIPTRVTEVETDFTWK